MKKSLADYMKGEDKPAKADKAGPSFSELAELHLFEEFMSPGYDAGMTHIERTQKQLAAFKKLLAACRK